MEYFGLIGRGIRHSFSPAYFQAKFIKLGIDAVYAVFDLDDISRIRELILSRSDIVGLNVTVPYKEKIIPFLDQLSPEAEKVSAVNTIKIHRHGNGLELTGFNTDIIGFKDTISPLIKERNNLEALVLGTGGSAKAVAYILYKEDISFKHVSRKPGKGMVSYGELNEKIISDHLLIINATPVGMFPNVNTAPQIPYQFVNKNHILFDLVYNPSETKFLKEGKKRGATVEGGLKMLHSQAEASWSIWQSH